MFLNEGFKLFKFNPFLYCTIIYLKNIAMRKKILISSLCLFGITLSYGQGVTSPQYSEEVGTRPIQQGNWIVGGAIGALGYSFESENFNINLMPKAGYFISDGIAIGMGVDLGFSTVKGGDNIWGYGIKPFVRYYFPEGSSNTGRFFGQGDIGITGATEGSADTSFAFGLNMGYAHFITSNVALEVTAGYNYSKSDSANAVAQNGLGVAVGFQIYLLGKNNL